MDLRIQIKTSDPIELEGFVKDNWMSEMTLITGSNEHFFGNIYSKTQSELNNIRKYLEALPSAFAFIELYGKLDRSTTMSPDELKTVQENLLTKFNKISNKLEGE